MKFSWVHTGVVAALAGWASLAHADLVPVGDLGTILPNGTVAFSNSNVTVGTIASPYNFLDQWSFTLGANASVSSIAATIFFGASSNPTFGITNLEINLVSNPFFPPAIVSWQTVTTNAGVTQVIALTPPSPLGAGNYFLQVRGTLTQPGAYSGSLIATPAVVPLPAALPLLVAGLGAFGVLGTRRRREAH